MKIIKTPIQDLILIEPKVFSDSRGFFLETFHEKKYAEIGIKERFVQDNQSLSKKGVLRGMHFQKNFPQGKLVQVLAGEVFDVAVDLRPESPTFRKWFGECLNDSKKNQLYVPPGFAHGFFVLSETALFSYKCTDFYRPDDECGFVWNDPEIGIEWPSQNVILSERDQVLPSFSQIQRKRSDI